MRPQRHAQLPELPVTVIGAGAVGSALTWLLALHGARRLTVYDFDAVEAHNRRNQLYAVGTVGRRKVAALATDLAARMGVHIRGIPTPFRGGPLLGTVFVATDTMASRRTVWGAVVRSRNRVRSYIDTRAGADVGRIYTVSPAVPKEAEAYAATLYSDRGAVAGTCANRVSAATAWTLAGIAVSTLENVLRGRPVPLEALVSLSPLLVETERLVP